MVALVTRSVEERLVRAAKRWASFQEGDSLEDQRTDAKLHAEAIEAREALLKIIEEQL